MKILFLHALADPSRGGGAEVIVWSMIRALRNAGHNCVLLATSNQPGLQRIEHEGITIWLAGIRNLYWPYHKTHPPIPQRMCWHVIDSYNPFMQGYLKQVILTEEPDVISAHNLPGWSALSWRTLSKMRIPTVQVLHDYYAFCIKTSAFRSGHNCKKQCLDCRALRLPHRKLSNNVQAVVGVSNYIIERHEELGYFSKVPMKMVIYNARSKSDLNVDSHASDYTHKNLRFGYIGRLDPSKGIEVLVRSFMDAGLPETELWIAGDGKKSYEMHLHNAFKSTSIHFMGRTLPKDFFSQIDVVVVPSLWHDNLPSVVFEAFAFGKPVIGSRRGGIPEMIRDGNNGLLFEPNNEGELIKAMQKLLDDPSLRKQMGLAAKESAKPFLDVDAWTKRYIELYGDVIRMCKTGG